MSPPYLRRSAVKFGDKASYGLHMTLCRRRAATLLCVLALGHVSTAITENVTETVEVAAYFYYGRLSTVLPSPESLAFIISARKDLVLGDVPVTPRRHGAAAPAARWIWA